MKPLGSVILSVGVVALFTQAARATPPVCFDFDGSLPPGATLTRATARYDSTGTLIPANTPRYCDDLIAPAAQLISTLWDFEQVMDTEVVNGTEYVAIIRNLVNIRLAIGTPECSANRVDLAPPASVAAKFGFNGKVWGAPRTIEMFPDGTVLVHCYLAGTERRAVTVRTSVAAFTDAQGWTLVRVSPYVPPVGTEPSYPIATFTRDTYLPNLNLHVSTIAEYTPLGLKSSIAPNRGRSLGFASTDQGLTWTRIIDTDDAALGRDLVEGAKHMHHLEPFEWFDTASQTWKIGAVGCLGDAEGEAGQIWVRSPFATYPVEGQNGLMTLERTRKPGRRALTDIFPIDNSQGAGEPLRFIQGNDGEIAGIVEARVENGVEENIHHFRPTVPYVLGASPGYMELPQYPFIFQMDRLGNGSVVAVTTEATPSSNPNGMWMSDASGTRWTTVRLGDNWGFNQVMPVGANRFWTIAILGEDRPFIYESELWQVGDPTPRTPVVLGASAHHVSAIPIFDAITPPGTWTDATGTVPPPTELPANTPIKRLNVQSIADGVQFSSCTAAVTGAAPGEYVQVVFWIRPVSNQAGAQSFQLDVDYQTGAGATVNSTRLIVDHETNMWTRATIVERVPGDGMSSITIRARCTLGSATPLKPIDFYLTPPRMFVSPQVVCQHVGNAGESSDRLNVQLPTLGQDWTIGVLATEARTFAVSLVNGPGDSVSVTPASVSPDPASIGADSTLELRTSISGVPSLHGATSAQDVFVPTQTLVFLRRTSATNSIDMWTSRGMGDFDTVTAPGVALTPTSVRFGSADWSTVFEGNVHRVKVWTDRALTETEMRRERLSISNACGDAPAIDVNEPVNVCPPPPPVPCLGDITGDWSTNISDFNALASNFAAGPGATRAQGDLTGDGYVTISDFNIVAGDFGCVSTPP